MASNTDLDQGGTARQWQKVNLGPTVGWLLFQISNVLNVVLAGITNVSVGTTLVTVNVNGAVTIQLPSAIASGGIPTTFLGLPITVVDIGGFAAANNITILPFGTETIMGLASIQIATNYGAFTLTPNTVSGGWSTQ